MGQDGWRSKVTPWRNFCITLWIEATRETAGKREFDMNERINKSVRVVARASEAHASLRAERANRNTCASATSDALYALRASYGPL